MGGGKNPVDHAGFDPESADAKNYARYGGSQPQAPAAALPAPDAKAEAWPPDDALTIRQWQERVHELAKSKGWYEPGKPRQIPEVLMLMVSELAEALEEYRNGKPHEYENDGKREGFAVELADCVIRIFDTAQYHGIDLGAVMERKHKYNKTREYRHGRKAC